MIQYFLSKAIKKKEFKNVVMKCIRLKLSINIQTYWKQFI